MKKRAMRMSLFILTVGFLLYSLNTLAGANDIKARMKQRLPEIKALKGDGIIGENNKGYLEFIGGNKAKAAIVDAENSDRRKVYAAIAKKTGSTLDNVGERRALQISGSASKGDWLQDKSGKWYQK